MEPILLTLSSGTLMNMIVEGIGCRRTVCTAGSHEAISTWSPLSSMTV
jgi:hypothetical protein